MTTYYYNGGQFSTSTSNLRQMIQYMSRSLSNIGYYSERVLNQALPNLSALINSDFEVTNTHLDHIDDYLSNLSFDSSHRLNVKSDVDLSPVTDQFVFHDDGNRFYRIFSFSDSVNQITAFPNEWELPTLSYSLTGLSEDSYETDYDRQISQADFWQSISRTLVTIGSEIFTPGVMYSAVITDKENNTLSSSRVFSLSDWFNKLGNSMASDLDQIKAVIASDDDLQLHRDTAQLVEEATDSFFTGSSGSKVSVSNISDASALSSGLSDLADTGGSVSSFFVQTGSDSHVWDWFTSDTQSDLDKVNSGLRLMSKKSSSNDIVTHYASDNYAQLQSLLGGD